MTAAGGGGRRPKDDAPLAEGAPRRGARRLRRLDPRHLEAHGRSVHDPLVRAWWDDTGFVGCCPRCGGWIHFTIRAKRAVTAEEAARYPQLPGNWHAIATIL
jgi:hypothetical protein